MVNYLNINFILLVIDFREAKLTGSVKEARQEV